MKIFRSIGEHAAEIAGAVRECMAILGETTVEFLLVPFNPRRFRVRDFMLAFERASFDALPVMSGVGFLLGVILAFQSAAALRTFGPKRIPKGNGAGVRQARGKGTRGDREIL